MTVPVRARALRIPTGVLLAALAAACGASPEPSAKVGPSATGAASSSAPSAPATPCDRATAGRARADRLVASGELDRASRVLAFADALCPASASSSATLRDGIAAALRPAAASAASDDARRAAATLNENAAAASARGDHAAARDLFLKAWEASHPNGRALVDAGVEAVAAGDAVTGSKLFARALAELDVDATPSAPTVHALDDWHEPSTWRAAIDGRLAAQSLAGDIVVFDRRLARRTLRLKSGATEHTEVDLRFAPDGARLAAGETGRVSIWDPFAGERLAVLTPRGSGVRWMPDGRSVAFSRTDPYRPGYAIEILAIEAPNGRSIRTVEQPDAFLLAYVASADRVVAIDRTVNTIFSRQVTRTPKPNGLPGLAGIGMGPTEGTDTLVEIAYFARTTTIADGKTTSRALVSARCEKIEESIPCGGECGPGSRTEVKSCVELTTPTLRRDGARVQVDVLAIPDHTESQPPTTMGGPMNTGMGGAAPAGPPPVRTRKIFDTQSGAPAPSLDETPDTAPSPRALDPALSRRVRATSPLDVAVAPSGTMIAIGLEDRTARLLDLTSGTARLLQQKPMGTSPVAFSPDGRGLVVATRGSVARYATDCAKPCAETWRFDSAQAHPFDDVGALAWSADGKQVVIAATSQQAFVVDGGTGAFKWKTHARAAYRDNTAAFTPDGGLVVADGAKLEVHGADGALVKGLDGVGEEVKRLVVTKDGKRLVTIGSTTLAVWDLAAGTVERKVKLGSSNVRRLVLSTDETSVCTNVFESKKKIACFALATLEKTSTLPIETDLFAFSPDGALVYGIEAGRVVVRRAQSAQEIARVAIAEDLDAIFVRASAGGEVDAMGDQATSIAWCGAGKYVFPYAACEQRFSVPSLLGKLVRGDALEP